MTKNSPSITVRELYEAKARDMSLKLTGGVNGLTNQITSPRIQKLGLALAGYLEYIRSGRVLFIGRTEINYLSRLESSEIQNTINRTFEADLTCIVATAGLDLPPVLVEKARENAVPILITPAISSRAIDEIVQFLEHRLAPSTAVHGVMMEVFGMGVLLLGDSGLGKSECGLELVLRGHRLISDDAVSIRRIGLERIVGSGPDLLPFHMELRGVGIINVRDLFGISSVSQEKDIDLVINLVRWRVGQDIDRLGMEEPYYTILNTRIPLIKIPVAPGRNVATLVEVAVRIHLLKKQGYEPVSSFVKKLEEQMRTQGQDNDE